MVSLGPGRGTSFNALVSPKAGSLDALSMVWVLVSSKENQAVSCKNTIERVGSVVGQMATILVTGVAIVKETSVETSTSDVVLNGDVAAVVCSFLRTDAVHAFNIKDLRTCHFESSSWNEVAHDVAINSNVSGLLDAHTNSPEVVHHIACEVDVSGGLDGDSPTVAIVNG